MRIVLKNNNSGFVIYFKSIFAVSWGPSLIDTSKLTDQTAM